MPENAKATKWLRGYVGSIDSMALLLAHQAGQAEVEADRDAALARAEAAEAERLKWAIALQSLTPGGSEFQTPDACVAMVRQRRDEDHERLLRFAGAKKAVEARLAEATRLLRRARRCMNADYDDELALAGEIDAFLAALPVAPPEAPREEVWCTCPLKLGSNCNYCRALHSSRKEPQGG